MITQRLLDNGFEETVSKFFGYKFNSKNNWFGVDAMLHPDAEFVRGNKKAIFSLQGFFTPIRNNISDELIILFNSCSVRYIGLSDGDNIIYETFTGILPSEKILTDFIANK